jgi:hypothetical protein
VLCSVRTRLNTVLRGLFQYIRIVSTLAPNTGTRISLAKPIQFISLSPRVKRLNRAIMWPLTSSNVVEITRSLSPATVTWHAVWFQANETASEFGRSDNYRITNGEVCDRKVSTQPEVPVGHLTCELRKIMTKLRVRLVVFRIEMPLYDA